MVGRSIWTQEGENQLLLIPYDILRGVLKLPVGLDSVSIQQGMLQASSSYVQRLLVKTSVSYGTDDS